MHSKTLFLACLEKLNKVSKNFETLLPHEFAILMHSFTQLQVNFLTAELINSIKECIGSKLLTDADPQDNAIIYNYHQLEKVYGALVKID